MPYAIVIERTATGFSAYVPCLPGCVATGATRATVRAALAEAIEFHIDGMRADNLPVPPECTGV